MSILIKGMELPKSCFDCPFMYGRRYCRVNSRIEFNDPEYSELKGRYDGCPLVEVPPHGRLIDADALIQDKDIDPFSAADVVERKRGRWKGAGMGDYYCSICQRLMNPRTNFCPNCGADMRGNT